VTKNAKILSEVLWEAIYLYIKKTKDICLIGMQQHPIINNLNVPRGGTLGLIVAVACKVAGTFQGYSFAYTRLVNIAV
jgi:hypothetical protein